ncbi:succinylglutamate desuccinylase/aspartoacylase family protein [Heliobacterium chlorum]|uniref:Succinylglutamate desuccinylase/aspartoacylase family protein n=1 Tax=Heliobacterium chlorum TaxID=2698 RepID=A0ABR7SYA8_HELCL|nr:M14 family metallopeptidase [Heliobacterium chlorum]MBC9782937.1 succinylglutamate desuccinylase/aspartoacylase family protein [Heliobacterium chlorum]
MEQKILTIHMPAHDQFSIRKNVLRPAKSSPTARAAIVSGIHGDELEGLYTCYLMNRFLQELREKYPERFRGQVDIYPSVNSLGLGSLTRSWPFFNVDLNRQFPGNREGHVPLQAAHALLEDLKGADLVVDIHASNSFLLEMPQIRMQESYAPCLLPLAEKANVDIIWLHGTSTVLETTLATNLNECNIPTLVVEMGIGQRLKPIYSERLMKGLIRLLQDLDILRLPEEELPFVCQPRRMYDNEVWYFNAEASGLFVAEPSIFGEWVNEGDVIGRIVDPLKGNDLQVITSPRQGLLFTLREHPVVYEGSLVARLILPPKPMPMSIESAGEDGGCHA